MELPSLTCSSTMLLSRLQAQLYHKAREIETGKQRIVLQYSFVTPARGRGPLSIFHPPTSFFTSRNGTTFKMEQCQVHNARLCDMRFIRKSDNKNSQANGLLALTRVVNEVPALIELTQPRISIVSYLETIEFMIFPLLRVFFSLQIFRHSIILHFIHSLLSIYLYLTIYLYVCIYIFFFFFPKCSNFSIYLFRAFFFFISFLLFLYDISTFLHDLLFIQTSGFVYGIIFFYIAPCVSRTFVFFLKFRLLFPTFILSLKKTMGIFVYMYMRLHIGGRL